MRPAATRVSPAGRAGLPGSHSLAWQSAVLMWVPAPLRPHLLRDLPHAHAQPLCRASACLSPPTFPNSRRHLGSALVCSLALPPAAAVYSAVLAVVLGMLDHIRGTPLQQRLQE